MVTEAPKRGPRGSTCIGDLLAEWKRAYELEGEGARGRTGSMPQAMRQSEAATRQKSTARRFVSICSVQ
ncbi:hypothetical protein GCM10023088_09810 [Actinomadura verrucosospora]